MNDRADRTSSRDNVGKRPARNREERRHPERLDLPAAAAWLGLSERHVRRLVQERRIAHYRIANRIVFDVTDLEAFLAGGRREAVR